MNYQKRLISIFRNFIEKILLPQIKKIEGNLLEWNRFNALLSNEIININELQMYVDSLPAFAITNNLLEIKDIQRKKDEIPHYIQGIEHSAFSLNKTFGGERSKGVVNIKLAENDGKMTQIRKERGKELSQGKEYYQTKQFGKEESLRKPNFNSMHNIGNQNPMNYQSISAVQNLERLLKNLIENQQKIEIIQSKNY